MIKLRVWANHRPMGWFGHEAAEYFFQYDTQWLQDERAFPLTPQFKLQLFPLRGDAVRTFFANLLPEGVSLDEVLNQKLKCKKRTTLVKNTAAVRRNPVQYIQFIKETHHATKYIGKHTIW